jgi:hypothetical protein
MRVFARLVLICLVGMFAAEPASAGWQVWTSAATERVLRETPAQGGVAVRLHAACNEWEGFQVLMRSDVPVRGIRLEPADLVGPGGATLPASTARLYRAHQFLLDTPSACNDAFRPGWYPDALIPFVHPLTGKPLTGGRLVAVPFDLPRDQTHGFWVDLYVPPNARPGQYTGVYRLTAAGGAEALIPVTLTVWDFCLPRVLTLQTAMGAPAMRMRTYYQQRAQQGKEPEPADWEAIETQCAAMVSEHHINAVPPAGSLQPEAQPDGSFRIPEAQILAFRRFVDQYQVNLFQTPVPYKVVRDPEAEKDKLYRWLASWDRAAAELDRPQVVFYTYLMDEPKDAEDYRFVQKWGRVIREAHSVVKVLVVEQTWPQKWAWGNLYGAVDIWCPQFPLFKPESAAARQALGETIWAYTAMTRREPIPWWETDFPLLNYRVPAWIAWRYRIRGLLYWGGMSFWNGVEDPWTDPKTLDRRSRRKDLLYNGDGVLVYPGRAVGYDGIAPSLRLKALRDSIEDYEYLMILQRAGLAAEADGIVRRVANSFSQWSPDPTAYQAARVRLAEAILKAGAGK